MSHIKATDNPSDLTEHSLTEGLRRAREAWPHSDFFLLCHPDSAFEAGRLSVKFGLKVHMTPAVEIDSWALIDPSHEGAFFSVWSEGA